MTDGHGRLPIVLTCVTSEGSEALFCGEVVVEFPNPLQVVELHFVFPNAEVSSWIFIYLSQMLQRPNAVLSHTGIKQMVTESACAL